MIVRAGTAVSLPILFASGQPDGDVAYMIFDPSGGVVGSGSIVVPAGDVSTFIQVKPEINLLPTGTLLSYRDVAWSYAVTGQVNTGELRYSVEARLPFGVSLDGVRSKLGVEKKDLADSEISLVKAYLSFQKLALTDLVDPNDSPLVTAIADAIEALAALVLVPTMAVRVAVKESSGTNQYQRQAVDWSAVQASLEGLVTAGQLAVNPLYDPLADFTPLFLVVTPAVDRFTGA